MTTQNVKLPASLSDATTKALVQLLNERFNAIPIQNVLVWHLETTPAEAVPHVAELLGLDGPEFGVGSGPPRVVLRQGVALLRIRGTIGAIRRVLRNLGFGEATFFVDGRRKYDGTFLYDGMFLYGTEEWAQWAIFGLRVETEEEMTVERARQLWDAIESWKGKRDWFRLMVRGPGDAQVVYSARSEIV